MGEKPASDKTIQPPRVWEAALFGCQMREVPKLAPGTLLSIVLVAFAVWATDRLNAGLGYKGLVSYILVAIVLGIVVRNTVRLPATFIPGINFCLRRLLRLGIILMGIRLSVFDAVRIGAWGVPIVVVCVLAGLVATKYLSRVFRLPERLGVLIAVGTSICGASAIVATAPGIQAKEEEVTYAVATITVFGLVAMVMYPYLARLMFLGNPTMAGLFTGTSIHETAQVAGAGLIYDQTFGILHPPTAADVAMVTKLVRNALMAVVIPAMAILYARGNQAPGVGGHVNPLRLFPLFIAGFLGMAIIRSLGDLGLQGGGKALGLLGEGQWHGLTSTVKGWSGYVLATAMTGVGLGTSFAAMKGLGIRPFCVGLLSAVLVGVVSMMMVFLVGPGVSF